jgi:hypothetical protein
VAALGFGLGFLEHADSPRECGDKCRPSSIVCEGAREIILKSAPVAFTATISERQWLGIME